MNINYLLNSGGAGISMEVLIIIWASVIAIALLLEFITYEFYTSWFAVGGIVAIILAAVGVSVEWQFIAFVSSSTLLLFIFRPVVKRYLGTRTIPTNLDANFGKEVRLLEDVVDGKTTIKVFGVTWVAECKEELKAGDMVIIRGTQGNKYTVEKI